MTWFRLLKVGGIYDTYGTYSPGFIGVGTLGVLGALILAAITIALPPRKMKYIDHRSCSNTFAATANQDRII